MFDHKESLSRTASHLTWHVTFLSHMEPHPKYLRLWPLWCTIKIKQGYQTVTSVIQNITQNRPSVCKNSVFICKIGFLGLTQAAWPRTFSGSENNLIWQKCFMQIYLHKKSLNFSDYSKVVDRGSGPCRLFSIIIHGSTGWLDPGWGRGAILSSHVPQFISQLNIKSDKSASASRPTTPTLTDWQRCTMSRSSRIWSR